MKKVILRILLYLGWIVSMVFCMVGYVWMDNEVQESEE